MAALAGAGMIDQARSAADEVMWAVKQIDDRRLRAEAAVKAADVLAGVGLVEMVDDLSLLVEGYKSSLDVKRMVVEALVKAGRSDDAADAILAEIGLVDLIVSRSEAADRCECFAQWCLDFAKVVDGDKGMWVDVGRGALTCSWFYGASVWDHFGILMRVAPELAVQLVDERILAEPEAGTASESDPDLGPEGPGGDAGSYR